MTQLLTAQSVLLDTFQTKLFFELLNLQLRQSNDLIFCCDRLSHLLLQLGNDRGCNRIKRCSQRRLGSRIHLPPSSQIWLCISRRLSFVYKVICAIVSFSAIDFLYHFRFLVAVRSIPPINSANSSRVNCTRPSSDLGQCNRPCSMRRAQTHRLLLSKKRIFMRSRLEFANKNRWPLCGFCCNLPTTSA